MSGDGQMERNLDVRTKLNVDEYVHFTQLCERLGLSQAALMRMALKSFMSTQQHRREQDAE